MSSESSESAVEVTETIFVAEEYVSSEDPPMDEWSSLVIEVPEDNKKKIMYEQGLYHPGSGEICAKYIAISDSAVFRHLYYNYPAVQDPGIKKALLQPEPTVIYSEDGQELYLVLCKEMGIAPVRMFSRGLLEQEINLKYYCVDPKGVRPMAIALYNNKSVKVFNLSDSFLNDDACYHLGEMCLKNLTLQELNLYGCKIKSTGVQRLFHGLTLNRTLKTLNLGENELGDDGAEYVAKAVFQGLDIQKLCLSHNGIGSRGASALAEAFETHNKFVELDLSWNKLFVPGATCNLLVALGESKNLQVINISWNSLAGPRIGTGINLLLKAPNLRHLDASHNSLSGEAITNLIGSMGKAKKLVTLDLAYNPMSPADAYLILSRMRSNAVKVQNILLDNVFVNDYFLELLKTIKEMKSRKNFVITYGGVIVPFKGVGKDPRELVLNRADFLAKKRKHAPDIALLIHQLVKDNILMMQGKDFNSLIQKSIPLDDDLLDEICKIFSGPTTSKIKKIDIKLLADYIKRKWPERKLPPTPPPEPEPEPEPEPVPVPEKKGKAKAKKK